MFNQHKLFSSFVTRVISVSGLGVFLLLSGLYIYYLRTGIGKEWLVSIQHTGLLGILAAISIQVLFNTLPVPAGFISVLMIGVYGPFLGGLFSWMSGIIGAVFAYYLSYWVARPIVEPLAKPHLEKVDKWLKKHGDLGLLLIRLIPLIPYHFVNYAAGILRVNVRVFMWTTAIGNIPYAITVSSLFAGLRYGQVLPFAIGGILFILSAAISIFLQKKMD